MVRVKSHTDVERIATNWLKEEYGEIRRPFFREVWKEEDMWIVEGAVDYKSGMLSWSRATFKLQINTKGDIVGYST